MHSLDAVDARLALPGADHPVVGGEEHVLGPPHGHPVHRQLVCAGVPDQPSVTGMSCLLGGRVELAISYMWSFDQKDDLTCLVLLSAQPRSPATENG